MADAVQIKLVLENEKLTKQLKDTERKFSKLEQSAKKSASSLGNAFTSAFSSIGAGWTAAAVPAIVLTSVINLSKAVSDLNDQANSLGVSFQNFQVLRYQALQNGTSIDKLTASLAKMQVAIGNAESDTADIDNAFTKLGLSVQDLIKLNADEQFIAISKALNAVEDPTKRAAIAAEIFGKGFRELANLMKDAEDGLESWTDEANKAGAVIDDLTKDKLAKFDDAWERLKIRFQVVKAKALTPLVQYMNTVLDPQMATSGDKIKALIQTASLLHPILNKIPLDAFNNPAPKEVPKTPEELQAARNAAISRGGSRPIQKIEEAKKTAVETNKIVTESIKVTENAFVEAGRRMAKLRAEDDAAIKLMLTDRAQFEQDIYDETNAITTAALNERGKQTEQMWLNVAGVVGGALESIVSGAQSASEALKGLLIVLAEAIVKALILMAINGKSFGSNLGYVFGGAAPAAQSSPQVRVFNFGNQAGGVQTRSNSAGGVDIIIGQIASAINKGGNPLDQALRRNYGLGRSGV